MVPISVVQIAKFGDAVVRVVALVVVALALALPMVVVLLVGAFKKDAQDYACAVLDGTGNIFKTILARDRGAAT